MYIKKSGSKRLLRIIVISVLVFPIRALFAVHARFIFNRFQRIIIGNNSAGPKCPWSIVDARSIWKKKKQIFLFLLKNAASFSCTYCKRCHHYDACTKENDYNIPLVRELRVFFYSSIPATRYKICYISRKSKVCRDIFP